MGKQMKSKSKTTQGNDHNKGSNLENNQLENNQIEPLIVKEDPSSKKTIKCNYI